VGALNALEESLEPGVVLALRVAAESFDELGRKSLADTMTQTELDLVVVAAQSDTSKPSAVSLTLGTVSFGLLNAEQKSIARFMLAGLGGLLQKQNYDLAMELSLRGMTVLNDAGGENPTIIENQRFLLNVLGKGNDPLQVALRASAVVAYLDLEWIASIVTFFKTDKIVVRKAEATEAPTPALKLQIQAAIDRHRPIQLNVRVEGATVKIPYAEVDGRPSLDLSFDLLMVISNANTHMDLAEFSTLFDHYSVSLTQVRVALIDRFIFPGFDVAVEADVAIIAAEFFESLKAEVSLSPLQCQVTTTQLLTLKEMAAYISDIFPPSLKDAARVSPTFAPENKIRVVIPSVTLDLAYDDIRLLQVLVESPINVAVRTKAFVADIALDIDALRVNEFLTGWDPPFVMLPTGRKVEIRVHFTTEDHQIVISAADVEVFAKSKVLNFLFVLATETHTYETRLGFSAESVYAKMMHKPVPRLPLAELKTPTHVSVCIKNPVARLVKKAGVLCIGNFDAVNVNLAMNPESEIRIRVIHPVVSTEAMGIWKTVAELPSEPLEICVTEGNIQLEVQTARLATTIPLALHLIPGFVLKIIDQHDHDPGAPPTFPCDAFHICASDVQVKVVPVDTEADHLLLRIDDSFKLSTEFAPSRQHITVSQFSLWHKAQRLLGFEKLDVNLGLVGVVKRLGQGVHWLPLVEGKSVPDLVAESQQTLKTDRRPAILTKMDLYITELHYDVLLQSPSLSASSDEMKKILGFPVEVPKPRHPPAPELESKHEAFPTKLEGCAKVDSLRVQYFATNESILSVLASAKFMGLDSIGVSDLAVSITRKGDVTYLVQLKSTTFVSGTIFAAPLELSVSDVDIRDIIQFVETEVKPLLPEKKGSVTTKRDRKEPAAVVLDILSKFRFEGKGLTALLRFQNQPFIRLEMPRFAIDHTKTGDSVQSRLRLKLAVWLLNQVSGTWDDLIAPFLMVLTGRQTGASSYVQLDIPRPLSFNLSAVFICDILSFKNAVLGTLMTSDFFVVRNEVGFDLLFRYGGNVVELRRDSRYDIAQEVDHMAANLGDIWIDFFIEGLCRPVFLGSKYVVYLTTDDRVRTVHLSAARFFENRTELSVEVFVGAASCGIVAAGGRLPLGHLRGVRFRSADLEPSNSIDVTNWRDSVTAVEFPVDADHVFVGHVRSFVDSHDNIGVVALEPSLITHNELPVPLTFVCNSETFKLKPNESVNLLHLRAQRTGVTIKISIEIEGFTASSSFTVNVKETGGRAATAIVRRPDSKDWAGVCVAVEYSSRLQKSEVYFYAPAILFNRLGRPLRIQGDMAPLEPDSMQFFASRNILNKDEFKIHVAVPGETSPCEEGFDCLERTNGRFLFLPRTNSDVFFPVLGVVEGLGHSMVATFLPALTIVNDLDVPLTVLPGGVIPPHSVCLVNSCRKTFTFSVAVEGFIASQDVKMDTPVLTVFRIIGQDGKTYLPLELRVTQDGSALFAHFAGADDAESDSRHKYASDSDFCLANSIGACNSCAGDGHFGVCVGCAVTGPGNDACFEAWPGFPYSVHV
jgi:hypothetical protein